MNNTRLAEQIRAFNRLYTEAIGSLSDQHEGLDVSLAQARILYSIRSLDKPQVNQVADALGLDLAYTSRVLGTLEDGRLIRRTISPDDRRQRVVALTAKGQRLLDEIERRSNQRVLGLIQHLDPDEVNRLLEAMDTVASLITKQENDDQQSD